MPAQKFADLEKLDNDDAVAKANAPASAAPKVDEDLIQVTITKFGDGLVSTGVHVTGEGDIYAKRGEKLQVSKGTAARLETLGLAETD